MKKCWWAGANALLSFSRSNFLSPPLSPSHNMSPMFALNKFPSISFCIQSLIYNWRQKCGPRMLIVPMEFQQYSMREQKLLKFIYSGRRKNLSGMHLLAINLIGLMHIYVRCHHKSLVLARCAQYTWKCSCYNKCECSRLRRAFMTHSFCHLSELPNNKYCN